MSDVNLSINKELVLPIIEAKINTAVCEALSGQQNIVSSVIEKVLNEKVDSQGNKDRYDSRESKTFIQWLCSQAIRNAAKEAVKNYINSVNDKLKVEIEKVLQRKTKTIAESVILSMIKGMEKDWNLKVNLEALQKGE